MAAARQAVLDADLGGLDDIERQAHDLATMTYEWQVGDSSGRFVDAAYPAVVPDAVDRLEEALLQLEEAAESPRVFHRPAQPGVLALGVSVVSA